MGQDRVIKNKPATVWVPCRDCGELCEVPAAQAGYVVVCADCAADEAFRRNPW